MSHVKTKYGDCVDSVRNTKGVFHQRRTSLNQVQIWPWPRFGHIFCCTNAVQIKSRVKTRFNPEPRRTSDQTL